MVRFSNEEKKKIIELHENTRMSLQSILHKIKPESIFLDEEFNEMLNILSEYYNLQGKSGIRSRRKGSIQQLKTEEKEGVAISEEQIVITDEEIYQLREKGYTYKDLKIYFEEQDKKISLTEIMKRCKKLEQEYVVQEPSEGENKPKLVKQYNKKQLAEMILKLKQTKNATQEQIEQIASIYGIDLKEFTNSHDER